VCSADREQPTVPPRLALHEIDVRFGGIKALHQVSFTAAAGEVLGIIGPNGAGKTTLFDVVAGVRPPTQGRVLLEGRDVTRTSSAARARSGLRRTFQRVQTFGWLSVEDNVLAATEWRGGSGGFLADTVFWPGRRRLERMRRRQVRDTLAACGLEGVRDELAGSLPIGVARLVELARAIVDEPTVLLLDEPASGLDDAEIDRLAGQIHRLRDETRCAVLLVEHNAGFVMDLSDHVVVLAQGQVLTKGLPAEVQRNQAVRDAYLGEVPPAVRAGAGAGGARR
jgi:branched-chain amino acid transport system ATP-binding protein